MKIDFISPFRGREDMVAGLLFNIQRFCPGAKTILIEQKDDEIFKHCHLRNICVAYITGDLLVFIDIYVRMLHEINFV